MKTNTAHFLRLMLGCIGFALITVSTNAHSEPTRKLVATGVTLQDVRVQILSMDESTGIAEVRFSGQDCNYCDEVYLVDQTTQIRTRDYQGSMDLGLLADQVFLTGSAHVIRADNWVVEVRYVDVAE